MGIKNHLWLLLNKEFESIVQGQGLRFCISKKLLGDAYELISRAHCEYRGSCPFSVPLLGDVTFHTSYQLSMCIS